MCFQPDVFSLSWMLNSMNEHLKLISISDLNHNKDSYTSIHLVQHFFLLMIKMFPAVMFGNSGIGSACLRVSASDCLYSLTGLD